MKWKRCLCLFERTLAGHHYREQQTSSLRTLEESAPIPDLDVFLPQYACWSEGLTVTLLACNHDVARKANASICEQGWCASVIAFLPGILLDPTLSVSLPLVLALTAVPCF